MLRYPGGKLRLMKKIDKLIMDVYPKSVSSTWVVAEPFVGGGGSLINMAEDFPLWTFHLNDLNKEISSLWRFFKSAKNSDFDALYEKIHNQKVTVSSYRDIFNSKPTVNIDRAFRVIFLNKTSFNGYVTESLPIGGWDQKSKWGVGVYWKPDTIIKKIERARAALKDRILSVSSEDYETFLDNVTPDFVYADPPYISNGKRWYKCFFDTNDLRHLCSKLGTGKWCLSIDKHVQTEQIFNKCNILGIDIKHSSRSPYKNSKLDPTIPTVKELVVFPEDTISNNLNT